MVNNKKKKRKEKQKESSSKVNTVQNTPLPKVTICTPTYNRRECFKNLIKCYHRQSYPKELIEWVIIDDGDDKIEDLVQDIPEVKYLSLTEKTPIGKKRNIGNDNATGEIIVNLDDDDYYPPKRVEHAVKTLLKNPQALCAGTTTQFIYYKHNKTLYTLGPFGESHATAGTFAYRRKLLELTRYQDTATMAEEKHFLKNYTIPLVQLDIYNTIIIISHDTNTYDKKKLLIPGNDKIRMVPFTIDHLIKDPQMLEAYTKDIVSEKTQKSRMLMNNVFSDTHNLFSLASKDNSVVEEDSPKQKVKSSTTCESSTTGTNIVVKDKNGNQRTLNSNEVVDVLSKQQKKISELLKIIMQKDKKIEQLTLKR